MNKNILKKRKKEKRKVTCLIGSHFLKLLLRIIFENKKTILVFFENYYCYMNLMIFRVICVLPKQKIIKNQT